MCVHGQARVHGQKRKQVLAQKQVLGRKRKLAQRQMLRREQDRVLRREQVQDRNADWEVDREVGAWWSWVKTELPCHGPRSSQIVRSMTVNPYSLPSNDGAGQMEGDGGAFATHLNQARNQPGNGERCDATCTVWRLLTADLYPRNLRMSISETARGRGRKRNEKIADSIGRKCSWSRNSGLDHQGTGCSSSGAVASFRNSRKRFRNSCSWCAYCGSRIKFCSSNGSVLSWNSSSY